MLPKQPPFAKRLSAVWIVVLCLGLYPAIGLANTAPLTAPMVPAQSTSTVPLEMEQSATRKVEIKEAKGEVTVQRQSSGLFQNIQSGDVMLAGDSIKIGDGSCRLLLDGKDDLFLGPHTAMKIAEASRNEQDKTNITRLDLESGKLKVMLSKLKKGSKFEVTTPTAIAAVRGTVFYLNIGNFQGQGATQLYVDETHGGVFFRNMVTGESFTVPAFSMSTSFADGRMNEPQHLNSEQRDHFVKHWERPGSNPSQQFGIEEISIPNPPPVNTGASDALNNLLDTHTGPPTNDAAQDKISDQNIPGANGLSAPSTSTSASTDAATTDPGTTTPDTPTEDQEKAMIRAEIARIRVDQDFDHADANLARISDAQTGKVMTDVFRNRVRVDQYIFHDASTPNTVQFLSLTARTSGNQIGVSSILFSTVFNRPMGSDVDIKSLPWNDYMNVVTRDDIAKNLHIALPGTPGFDPVAYNALADEYILHEHAPGLTQGDSLTALYPVLFSVQLTNPVAGRAGTDMIEFDDFFSPPVPLILNTPNTSLGYQSFTAQSEYKNWTIVAPFQDQQIKLVHYLGGSQTISIGGGDPRTFIDNPSDSDNSGPQTASFASNFNPSNLQNINYYRALNDEHPSYFDNRLGDRLDANSAAIVTNHLIGVFVPIDNDGHIIDQPGFQVRGARDILNPNPLVNGGNYNLEIIMMYGYTDNQPIAGSQDGLFHENFRIDVIVTPEIFSLFSNYQGDESSLFPPALHPDDDN